MRRQYHSHQVGKDKHIWDVHRLVELSRDLPVIEVEIESIAELDERSWFEKKDEAPSCREVALHSKLIEEADLKYPIILGEDGRVMDGMHRICKAWIRGDKTILAVRFNKDPEPANINVKVEELSYDEPW